jgi:aromatic ring-opening dioxygenase catalytic subunit (LigB family)
MELCHGLIVSHAPGMTAMWDALDAAEARELSGALDAVRRELEVARPDVLVAFVNDHFSNFFLGNMPAICVGVADSYEMRAPGDPATLRTPMRRIAGEPDLSLRIVESLMRDGFDPAYAGELQLVADVGAPLYYLMPELPPQLTIVPIFINCVAPPLPTMRRCYDLGIAVRRALDAFAGDRRVAIMGTGGISHWVGLEREGEINSEFDRRVIALVEDGRFAEMLDWDDRAVEDEAGNGAYELRNWLATFGAVGACRPRSLAYVAVPEWLTGMTVIPLDLAPLPVPV